jgi:hypothetical protein
MGGRSTRSLVTASGEANLPGFVRVGARMTATTVDAADRGPHDPPLETLAAATQRRATPATPTST